MRRRIGAGALVVACLVGPGWGCGSPTSPEDLPWMRALITRLQSEPVGTPPAQILEYRYQGRLVYFVPVHRCCDFMSDLYDRRGNLICHPDGGIAGYGDGRCSDFFAQRTGERLIWSDTRS